MAFLSKVHLSCFLLSYLLAFAGEILQVLRGRSRAVRIGLLLLAAAGLVAHTAYLVTRSRQSGLPPLVGSSHDWLLVLAWLGAVMYLAIALTHEKSAQGLFLLPAVLIMVVLAVFVEGAVPAKVHELAETRWGMLHASTLVLGIAAVVAATLTALMYLLQHQGLRRPRSGVHRLKLPSLERLSAVNRWLVVGSVPMLTVGLFTGFVLAAMVRNDATTSFRWTDPIVIGTLIVWCLMVAVLAWMLTRKDQTGRSVAKLTVLAGGFLLLTIFGLTLLAGGFHTSRESTSAEYRRVRAIATTELRTSNVRLCGLCVLMPTTAAGNAQGDARNAAAVRGHVYRVPHGGITEGTLSFAITTQGRV
ncbi:MAG: cytochrome c biogenesis protein CcsA [Planctomycetaceae bacterium]